MVVDRELKSGEKILRRFRQSRIRLYMDLGFVLIAFVFLGIVFALSSLYNPIIIVILLFLAILLSGAVFTNWYFTVYIITSVRVEYQTGIIAKFEEEIALEDIQTVDTHQDIVGRIFDHGDISIESAGLNTIILKNVKHAHRLAHEIANLSLEYNKDVKLRIPRNKKMFVDE